MNFTQDLFLKRGVVLASLNPAAYLFEACLAIPRIVNKAIFFNRGRDSFLEMISADEFLIEMKRNRKASGNDNSRQARVDDLAEVRRLCAKANRIARALKLQVSEPLINKIRARRYQIAALDPFAIAPNNFARVRRLKRVAVLANFESNVFAFELFEEFVRVFYRRVGNRPRLGEHVDV